jgi:hypothetical protein
VRAIEELASTPLFSSLDAVPKSAVPKPSEGY